MTSLRYTIVCEVKCLMIRGAKLFSLNDFQVGLTGFLLFVQ